MKTLTRSIFILIFTIGVAGAGETFSGTHNFGSDGLLWNYKSQQWTDNDSVNWIHTLSEFENSNSVTTASLPIQGKSRNTGWPFSDTRNDPDSFKSFPGRSGSVLPQSRSERFEYDSESQSDFNKWEYPSNGFSGKNKRNSNVYLNQDGSKDYPSNPGNFDTCYPPSVPPATVPAPGAIILAGIGTVLVGLLRRKEPN